MKVFVIYDLEDNYIAQFDRVRDMAVWLERSTGSLWSSISRFKSNDIKFIRDKKTNKKYKVYKINIG